MLKTTIQILIILICAATAYAGFIISPQVLALKVNTGERVGWVELAHTGGSPIAVELTAHQRILDLDGDLDSLPASDDFLVYPSQILLYPNGKAKAQVVLKGKEKITADKAYILHAKEIPFNFPKEEVEEKINMGITVSISYQIVIALETNKSGTLSFVSSKALDSGYVEVIVENKGTGRVKVPAGFFYIMAGGKKITEFSGAGNSIMPGQKRRFTFKHSKPLSAKEFSWGTD
jgi:P pilus assembly chaperone PapD